MRAKSFFPSPHFTFLRSTGTCGSKICLRNREGKEKSEKLHFFFSSLKSVHEGSVACVERVRCAVAFSDIIKGSLGPEGYRWGCQSEPTSRALTKTKGKKMDA